MQQLHINVHQAGNRITHSIPFVMGTASILIIVRLSPEIDVKFTERGVLGMLQTY